MQFNKTKIANIGNAAMKIVVGISIPALCCVLPVLNYKVPKDPSEELYKQRQRIYHAECDYIYTRDSLAQRSMDTLYTDPQYKNLSEKLNKLSDQGYDSYNSTEYLKLESKLDSLGEYLRGEYISNKPEMVAADNMISEKYSRLYELQQDSALREAILQIPISQRLRENWLQIRIDRNKKIIKLREKRLMLLQQKQQQNSK